MTTPPFSMKVVASLLALLLVGIGNSASGHVAPKRVRSHIASPPTSQPRLSTTTTTAPTNLAAQAAMNIAHEALVLASPAAPSAINPYSQADYYTEAYQALYGNTPSVSFGACTNNGAAISPLIYKVVDGEFYALLQGSSVPDDPGHVVAKGNGSGPALSNC